jgi:hypothetical protein
MYTAFDPPAVSFSGHESFPLRYSWLKKGYQALKTDLTLFSQDDALVRLGVGKNMVRAIRHWGLASGMWEEEPGSRGRKIVLTDLAHLILDDASGYDPYLERIETWWFLHGQIVTNQRHATAWAWLFGRPKANRFEKSELAAELEAFSQRDSASRVSAATIRRDVDVLIRTYCRTRTGTPLDEDGLDSPFLQLGLIRQTADKSAYELVQAARPNIPLWVFRAHLNGYLLARGEERGSARSVDDLMYSIGSPGRIFRLSEESLVRRLVELAAMLPDHYQFDETAGLRQLYVVGEIAAPGKVLASICNDGTGAVAV